MDFVEQAKALDQHVRESFEHNAHKAGMFYIDSVINLIKYLNEKDEKIPNEIAKTLHLSMQGFTNSYERHLKNRPKKKEITDIETFFKKRIRESEHGKEESK